MATKSRLLSRLIEGDGNIKTTQIDSDAIGTSAAKSITAASGTTIYSSADTLPASAATGDQAFVSSTNRLYIYNGSGWYNIALINSTPYWSSEANTTYDLSTTGAATVITILAVDSEGVPITYTATTDSDFDSIATISKDSDNGRTFTIIPTDSENGTSIAGTGTVTFRASDGVNLVSTLSTFSITFQVLNSNYTTLLLKADSDGTDNQVDASGENHAINTGAKSTAFTPYHPGGYSTYFDGTGDYMTVASTSDFGFGTNSDFTLEAWIYPTTTTGDRALFDFRTSANDTATFFIDTSTGKLAIWNGTKYGATGTVVSANEWHHVAFVRSGSTTTAYLDGSVDFTTSTSFDFSSAKPLGIGGAYYSAGSYFTGYFSDYRIISGTALYTSSFTPPTGRLTAVSGTVLLACHLPYLSDGSTSDHTLTIAGNTSTKRFGPYDYIPYNKADHGGSLKFNSSTNDYMTTDGAVADADFTLGTGDFTIEYWTYWTGTNVWITVDFRTSQNQAYPALYRDGNTGALTYYVSGANKIVGSGTTGTIYANVWNHIALVRNSGTTTLYKDGVSVGSFSDNTNYASGYWKWGRNENTWYFDGFASDMRLVKDTAVYTADFTPPTAPLTAITNTKLLTATNKNNIWDTGSGNVLTKNGNVTASATQTKFATSDVIYFDGNGDYITTSSDVGSLLSMGSGDFTAEGWFYFNSLPSSGGSWHLLFAFRDGSNEGIALYVDGSTPHLEPYTGSQRATGSTTLSTGQWYHIAFVRNSGTVYGYVNGNQDFTYAYSTTVGTITTGYIGGAGTQYINGYVQDLRVTKGLARYTTSFTPPTAEFDG